MFDKPTTISDALRSAARACPEKAAIIDAEGELSYREFDRQVDALASCLAQAGVERNESVAYLFWNQRELLISYFAITRIASVTVSLNYRLTAAELAHQLVASETKAIIYDASFLPEVEQAVASVSWPILRIQAGQPVRPDAIDFAEIVAGPTARDLLVQRLPRADDFSGIWFTSGTEGKPKGAIVRHNSSMMAALVCGNIFGIARDTRCLAVAPMFHRGAMEAIALPLVVIGATQYLQPRFDPAAVITALRDDDINVAFIVPTMARLMLQTLGAQDVEPLPSLHCWVSASAHMPVELAAEVRRRFSIRGAVINAYGITEMLQIAQCQTFSDDEYEGAVGCPIPLTQVEIYDDKRGLLPRGEVGEVVARGPLAFSHYLNDPEATDRVRIELDGQTWYRSGDVGRIDSRGNLFILDRKKDMIISGGENIYSAEVEAALIAHPAVAEVAVIGREDEQWGEIVVALIVLKAGATGPTLPDLRASSGDLASYKHPKEVVIVDALPRNSFGKVQKHVLRQRLPTLSRGCAPAEV